ncbi:hypothetical protein BH20ACT24_BH20ACT24_13880 [soil metagenome]
MTVVNGEMAGAAGVDEGGIPGSRRRRTRVAIGIQDLAFHHEVLDFLDRDPRMDIVGAVGDPDRFPGLLSSMHPDVALSCPSVGRALRAAAAENLKAPVPVMQVAEEMTVPVLRDAIDAGAAGVFSWPEERSQLAEALASMPAPGLHPSSGRGRVLTVLGVRGGAGATFVSTHLTAAFADRGLRAVLVDLDHEFADLTPALGISSDQRHRSVADLLPVMDELDPDHVEDVLFRHSRGFSVMLGPPAEADMTERNLSRLSRAAVALLAITYQAVVLHAPRRLGEAGRAAVRLADDVILVVGLDLFSLHGARRVVQALGLDAMAQPRIVVNQGTRSTVSPKDVERVLGMAPIGVIRSDRAVKRAQDQGRLLPRRARRAGGDVRALADAVLAAGSDREGASQGGL